MFTTAMIASGVWAFHPSLLSACSLQKQLDLELLKLLKDPNLNVRKSTVSARRDMQAKEEIRSGQIA